MTRYALDTSTFSLLMRRDEVVVRHLESLSLDDRIAICAVVRGEIAYGLARLSAGRRKQALEARIRDLFEAMPCDPVTDATADHYGEIKRRAERKGMSLSDNDLWIAAAALAAGETLVTADTDLRRLGGLTLEDWSVTGRSR